MTTLSHSLAHRMLEIGAIDIRLDAPFTWSSGWTSPMYCDNRLLLSYPASRDMVKKGFVDLLTSSSVTYDVIAGVATAGIPHGALLADALDLPFVYVRSKAKAHGRQNQIEGRLTKGARVLVIEDLISTGNSSIQAALALRDAGAKVNEIWSICSYGFPEAEQAFHQNDMTSKSLVYVADILHAARAMGRLDEQMSQQVETWRSSPSTWKAPH